jgi:phage repressor protein C with HTH and peptisase S24 domain
MDAVRKRILRRIEERGLELKAVSLAMGRSHSYMQQYLHRNVPLTLKEQDRRKLSEILDVPESEIGGPADIVQFPTIFRSVPEYDVRVSAGGGSLVSDEKVRGAWPFSEEYLSSELHLSNRTLAVLEVRGDSMEPTLTSGDRVLVDMDDKQVSQPGIFVIHDGDGTVIKRVEKIPGKPILVLISDNPLHGKYEIDGDDIRVVGRVVWRAGRI